MHQSAGRCWWLVSSWLQWGDLEKSGWAEGHLKGETDRMLRLVWMRDEEERVCCLGWSSVSIPTTGWRRLSFLRAEVWRRSRFSEEDALFGT